MSEQTKEKLSLRRKGEVSHTREEEETETQDLESLYSQSIARCQGSPVQSYTSRNCGKTNKRRIHAYLTLTVFLPSPLPVRECPYRMHTIYIHTCPTRPSMTFKWMLMPTNMVDLPASRTFPSLPLVRHTAFAYRHTPRSTPRERVLKANGQVASALVMECGVAMSRAKRAVACG